MGKKNKNRSNPAIQAKKEAIELPPLQDPWKFNTRLPYYILFVLAMLLYANTLVNRYALDDLMMVTENKFTKKGFSGIGDILTTDSFVGFFGEQKNLLAGGRYRPLSHITFAIEYALFGLNPFVSHLINILLYAFAGLLVYKVLKMLFPPEKKEWYLTLPFLAAVLFVAHPLHTEAVANIKGRDEIMSLLGSFGAFYFVLKYVKSDKALYLLPAFICLFLGLMSKENAITFLGIIPLSMYFFTNAKARHYVISFFAALVPAAIVFIAVRYKALGFIMTSTVETELLNNPFIDCTTMQKYATLLFTWGKYLQLLVFPHPLTHDYYPKQIPIINFGDVRAIVPLLMYLSMLVYALVRFKRKDIISFCILFFAMSFSISSNLFFGIGTFMNERFMFVPLLGYCLLLAYGIPRILERFMENKKAIGVMMGVFGVVLAAYSLKTITRNPVWKSDYVLFTTDVKTSWNSAKCTVSAGGQTLEMAEKETDQVKKKKMIDDALAYLNRGITIHPKYAAGWLLIGKAYIDLEDFKTAREYYEVALKVSPGNTTATTNWLYCAQKSTKNKDYKEAAESYRKLITYQPGNNDLYVQLAGVYEETGQLDSALALMDRRLAKDPKNAAVMSKLGEIYGKYLNNLDKSLEYLLAAYAITPNDASLLENLGVAYGIKGNFIKSIEYFKKAIAVKPDNAQTYTNLAGSYRNIGDKKNEAECLAKAEELKKKPTD